MRTLKEILRDVPIDSIGRNKAGVYKAKRKFYYRHGYSATQLVTDLSLALVRAGWSLTIQKAEEHWNPWPRDSWWEVRFTVVPPDGIPSRRPAEEARAGVEKAEEVRS